MAHRHLSDCPGLLTRAELGRDPMLAMQAVEEALQITRAIDQAAALTPLPKHDASPVTMADFSVQGLVAARLSRDFPRDDLVAEEDADACAGPRGPIFEPASCTSSNNPIPMDSQAKHVVLAAGRADLLL